MVHTKTPNHRHIRNSGHRVVKEMAKKKRPQDKNEQGLEQEPLNQADVIHGGNSSIEKPKKKNKKSSADSKKVTPTVSIAVPASIIDNTQSFELATRLVGQIARAATIFRIDEIVVFDNNGASMRDPIASTMGSSNEEDSSAAFFIRILRYLETPQYLRKALFPRHNSLRCVGLLPPLDAPHHLRKHEWGSYREGVTLKERAPVSGSTMVDVGLSKNVVVDRALEPGVRVTVAMGTDRNLSPGVLRQIVPNTTPGEIEGTYWGYKVRYAPNLSCVFENSPYEVGYDHVIGTSEHGQSFNSSEFVLPSFRHLLITFGGLAGLEESIEEDVKLKGKDARDVFHSYLNICPHQGSRTIRTEEAIFICLQYFQEPIHKVLQNI